MVVVVTAAGVVEQAAVEAEGRLVVASAASVAVGIAVDGTALGRSAGNC